MGHATYWVILIASISVPLACSFYPKAPFYKQWKHLFPALLLTAVFFLVWDHYFTIHGVWSFNPDYTCGIKYFELPIEEILFFFIIPYCCVFIYEALNHIFPKQEVKPGKSEKILHYFITVILMAIALLHADRAYTFTASFLAALMMMLLLYLNVTFLKRFYSTYLISLIPFAVVNGFLTAIPVVEYNDAENMGIRLYTIPAEDTIYSFLMLLMCISWMEFFRSRKVQA